MLTLPEAILPVLIPFATLFRSPTWRKAQILLVGAVLAPGQRTVASALRVMGLSDDRNYARYHHVLNRAAWSPLKVSRILLGLLILYLDRGDGPLIFGIDETLERRRGPKIKARGVYRDAVRSSRQQLVKASGLRWISLMWLGHVPFPGRDAIGPCPFLPCWRPRNATDRQRGRRHKKLTDWARQMILQLRRWLPHRPLVLVGDSSYAVLDLGLYTAANRPAACAGSTPCYRAGALGYARAATRSSPTAADDLQLRRWLPHAAGGPL